MPELALPPRRADAGLPVSQILTDPETQLGGALAADLIDAAPDSAGFVLGDAYVRVARQRNRPDAWALAVTTTDPDLGSALVRAALVHVGEHGGGRVTMWRAAADSRDDLLAAEAGMRADRGLHRMTVPLPITATAAFPSGVELRTFDRDRDLDAWLALNNEAFAGHAEQGGWTRATFAAFAAQPWFDPTLLLLAEDDAGLLGFNWIKMEDPPLLAATAGEDRPGLRRAEIHVIGVAARAQGRGLGRALAAAGLERAHARGATHGLLYVAADNRGAIHLYEQLGFTIQSTDRAYVTDVEAQ